MRDVWDLIGTCIMMLLVIAIIFAATHGLEALAEKMGSIYRAFRDAFAG